MRKRIVLVHPVWGIFLGQDIAGIAHYSLDNPHRIPAAVTFESLERAREFFGKRYAVDFSAFQAIEVDTEGDQYASILQMNRAGITDPKIYGDMLAAVPPLGGEQ